jgi:hypothetical protein
VLIPAEQRGRLGYNTDRSGVNFLRNRVPVSAVCEQIER